jgi:predicted dehydrogenase
MNRRAFVKGTLAGGLGVWSAPAILSAAAGKSYDTVLIGSGWWGMNILREAMASGRCRVTALCDVDAGTLKVAVDEVEKLTGKKPKAYRDYRELIRKEKPQVAIVATPDHWHALPALEALRSGAHVYLEKPIGHTIEEGKALVEAGKMYGGIVQVGFHRHISPHNVSGMEFLRSGKAGKIHMVRAFVLNETRTPGPVTEEEPPEGLDWDFWCGPAPLRPYTRAIHPRGFRNYLDFANGMCGDWGVHWFDQILWWSEEKHPRRVFSTGGRIYDNPHYDAPDYQVATFEFESFTATWEHRRFAGNESEKHNIGAYFYGTAGVFHMGWLDGWTFYPNKKGDAIIHQDHGLHLPDHQNIRELWADFMDAIDRRREPVAGIENSHYATNMSLLAMISMKLGRSLDWDGQKQMILNDPAAISLMRRPYRAPWQFPAV